jgi:hypothetical protein
MECALNVQLVMNQMDQDKHAQKLLAMISACSLPVIKRPKLLTRTASVRLVENAQTQTQLVISAKSKKTGAIA